MQVSYMSRNNPVSFTEQSAGNYLYAISVPEVSITNTEVIATLNTNNTPVSFLLKGSNASGGRIICNTGLPTTGGMNNLKSPYASLSRQLCWSINSIFYAFCSKVDYTRSVFNNLPAGITAGVNAVAHDRIDTFEVRIKLRNLSDEKINTFDLYEYVRTVYIDNKWKAYFTISDVQPAGINYSNQGTYLNFSNITLEPRSELVITYKLITPDPDDPIHEKINNLISWANYIYASFGQIKITDNDGVHLFWKYRNYVDMMFAARIVS